MDLSTVKRVLVIKLRHLGDVLLTTPVFSVLQRALPHAKIDAYVYAEAKEILEGHPSVSKILCYDRNWKKLHCFARLFQELRMLRMIRKQGYDLVLNLTEGDRGAMVSFVSGARFRLGVDERRVYTHVVKRCPTLRHTVERHLDSLRRLGLIPLEEEKRLTFAIPKSAHLGAVQKNPWDDFILIHPTSRWRFKCWPVERMRVVAARLVALGERLVITAGPDPTEMLMAEEILAGLPSESVCNLAGQVTLKELGALMLRAKKVICVDSVALHMASALQVPVIALFGPTSDVTWGPWLNEKARVITAPMSCRPCYLDGCGGSKRSECLYAISVERVLSEISPAPRERVFF